jgi:hypothetical protein
VAYDEGDALPEEFFVYVTEDDPVVRWNIEDEWLPFVPNPSYPGFLSMQTLRTTTNYRAEYHAEVVRRRAFRTTPSRLSALFAWGSLEEARAAATSQSGGRYRRRPLKRCALRGPPLRALRANGEILPLARSLERTGASTPELVDAIWGTYWSGSGERVGFNAVSSSDLRTREETWSREEPLWEWLLDASLDVIEDVTP